jgi:hypothetical protein
LRRLLVAFTACLIGGYAAALLAYNPLTLSLFGGSSESVPLADFGSFYASGQAAGRGLDPYAVYPLTLDASLGRGTGAAINLNPPILLPLFQLVSVADPVTGRRIWFVATFVAYALTVVLLIGAYPTFRSPLTVAWSLLLTGFIETVLLGQVYTLLALASTAAWVLLLRQRVVPASGLIGFVVACKPNFMVWPLLLVLGGHRRVGLWALGATVAYALIPLALYGPGVYAEWIEALRQQQVNSQVANASLDGLLVRDGAPQSVAAAVSAMLLAALAVWAWQRKPSVIANSGVGLVGSLLASPLAWVGYTLFLLPVVARTRLTVVVFIACALLCVPRLVLQEWANTSAVLRPTVGAAYSVGWLILLFTALRGDRD